MDAATQPGSRLTREQAPHDAATPDMVLCPECGALAEIEWSDTVDSTEGPVEHAKIVCARRHWFLMPTERLFRS
jgi:hypothetical protein